MGKQIKKLNIGCGKSHLENFINMDIVEPADIIADVRKEIPFKDNYFDYIIADNLVEHFSSEEFIFVMNEIHRVLKVGKTFWFKVPNAEKWFDGAFGDPTHKKFFTNRSFLYFEKENPQYENYGKSYGLKGWKRISLFTDEKFFEWIGEKDVS